MSLTADWIVGFSDGESSFQVLIQKSKVQLGFSLQLRFTIGLIETEKEIIDKIQRFFGVGKIVYRNLDHIRKEGIGSKNQIHYVVGRLDDLRVIRDFFNKHPLQSEKAGNFKIWSQILDIVLNGRANRLVGFLECAKLRDQMKVKTRNYRYRNYEWFMNHWHLNNTEKIKQNQ